MVRPSYVLGGRAMEIVYNEAELRDYMSRAVKVTPDHPVLVDRYMQGTEVEVDGISDGVDVVISGIMEHVERAGVHSGDSIAVYPPQTLSSKVIYTIIDYTKRLALSLHVKGLLNIQFVVVDGEVYIIEVNPRSSRTVPFLSKVTNVDMVGIATRIAMGHTLKEFGYKSGLVPPKPYVAVKAPVFSFAKMTDVDIALGPEMKSTGEVMGIDYHYARALYKAIIGSGINVPTKGCILFTVADKDKEEMKQLAKAFSELGFEICATEGTAKAIQSMGIDAKIVGKVHERSSDIIQMIKNGKINMVINTLTQGKHSAKDGFKIRRATVEHGIACLTSLDTAWEVLRVLSFMRERRLVYSLAIQDYVGGGDDDLMPTKCLLTPSPGTAGARDGRLLPRRRGSEIAQDCGAANLCSRAHPFGEFTLRRPVGVAAVDEKKGSIAFIYRVVGKGTRALSQLMPGEIVNVLGPLGHGHDGL